MYFTHRAMRRTVRSHQDLRLKGTSLNMLFLQVPRLIVMTL